MISSVFSRNGGSGARAYEMVDLSNQINNSNQNFTLKPFRRGTILVFYNGLAQRTGSEIIEISRSEFRTSFVPSTGSILLVFFQPL
mgnify:CR=1 FL=1|tara:strand:+ start:158 stop:415 length:258 start_codon:yes stop_codon:yes gene_type:complete